MKKTLMILLVVTAAIYGKVSAQTPVVMVSDTKGWHKIGETTVNFQKDSDEIVVVGADRFAKIQFKIEDAPIHLTSLKVFYESGDNQNISINMPIKAPGESRIIELNGGERSLKKIDFVYSTLPNRKDVKAHVEIWGLKTNTDKK